MKKTPFFHIVILIAFTLNSVGPLTLAQAEDFKLPAPGVMVRLSPPLDPPMLKGIRVHPDSPFNFDFILDKGDSELTADELKDQSSQLIKYFLASLTIPEKDLWVNLSPYEKERIIPRSFGLTEMGRDLLAEDYMLKQITASLIYPEDKIGKKFWMRVYSEAEKKYGTTNIPLNTFNKVWIVPEKAVVYENTKAGTAYIVESKLKVMLDQDYLAFEKNSVRHDTNALGSQIVREVIIPELTKEVNENKNFSKLRQVYNSLILATWYKKKIKDSILEQVYVDKNKVAGVNIDDPNEKQRIYEQYLRAFKKGVYNYIKDDTDPITQDTIPRKYFSGGLDMTMTESHYGTEAALVVIQDQGVAVKSAQRITDVNHAMIIASTFDSAQLAKNQDHAMSTYLGGFLKMLQGLMLKKTPDLNEVYDDNLAYGKANNEFFSFFSGIRKSIVTVNSRSSADKIKSLRSTEASYFEKHPEKDFYLQSPEIQLNWLFNMYKELSSWEDMIRIYKKSEIERPRGEFTEDQYIANDYVLALNRSGQTQQALDFLNEFRSKLEQKGITPIPEMHVGYGTTYKNLWVASNESTQHLEKSYEKYLTAYKQEDSYYAGINVIRILIYQGKIKAAQELRELVLHSAIAADNNKSFWVKATLLELALIESLERGNDHPTSKVEDLIPKVIELANGGGELESLLVHLERWSNTEHGRDQKILIETIAKLKQLRIETPKGKVNSTLIGALSARLIDFGKFLRIIGLPNNWQSGGVVQNSIISAADRIVARKIIGHQLKSGDFIPVKGRIGKSLGDIINVNDADDWIDSYVEWLFGLKDKNGNRVLEVLNSPEHQDLDKFFSTYKKFSGMDAYEKGSDALTGADNVTMTAMARKADCRLTNAFKTLLLGEWNKVLWERFRQEALNSFQQSLRDYEQNVPGAFDHYESLLQIFKDKVNRQYGIMQVFIYANIKGEEIKLYSIPTTKHEGSGKELPTSGNGLVVYRDSQGEESVLINDQNSNYKKYAQEGSLQEIKDATGKLLGYKHPYLEIRKNNDGSEYLFRSLNDPAISLFLNDKKDKLTNKKLKPIEDKDNKLIGANDTTLTLVRDPVTHHAQILRLLEDHVTGVQVDYDLQNGELQDGEFRDTWYNNSSGSPFYRYNRQKISLKGFEDLLIKGQIEIPNGIAVLNPETGKIEEHSIVMKLSPYSDPGRILNPHRYSPQYLYRGGQRLFDTSSSSGLEGILRVLFRQDIGERIQTEVNTPITNWKPPINDPAQAALKEESPIKKRNTNGGIDFSPSTIDLQIKGTESGNGGIKFHLDPAMMERLRNTPGFVPVIINIKPVTDLGIFLGFDNKPTA